MIGFSPGRRPGLRKGKTLRFWSQRRFNRRYLRSLQHVLWFWIFLFFSVKIGFIIHLYTIAFTDFRLWGNQILKIKAPTAKIGAKRNSQKYAVLCAIKENGDIVLKADFGPKPKMINKKEYKEKFPETVDYLHHLFTSDPALVAEIFADKNCTMEPVLYVLKSLKEAGIRRIAYVVSEPE